MTVSMRKAQVLARALLESPDVVTSVKQRLMSGTLPEEIELLLWDLAYPPARRSPGSSPSVASLEATKRRPTLAFPAPLSADELDARLQAAALDGDVAAVATLTTYQERTS